MRLLVTWAHEPCGTVRGAIFKITVNSTFRFFLVVPRSRSAPRRPPSISFCNGQKGLAPGPEPPVVPSRLMPSLVNTNMCLASPCRRRARNDRPLRSDNFLPGLATSVASTSPQSTSNIACRRAFCSARARSADLVADFLKGPAALSRRVATGAALGPAPFPSFQSCATVNDGTAVLVVKDPAVRYPPFRPRGNFLAAVAGRPQFSPPDSLLLKAPGRMCNPGQQV